MTQLTQIAITTRKIIRYGIYFIIFLIVGRIFLGIGISIFNTVFPKPPPPATVAFGKLPKPIFPQRSDLPKLTYKLDTISGDLPALPTQAKVYYMPGKAAGLFSLETTKQKVSAMGFSKDPQVVSETEYKFSHSTAPATLDINIITGVFSVSYNLGQDTGLITERAPQSAVAQTVAQSFLSSGGFLPADLTRLTADFLKVENRQLVNAVSQSEGNFVKVNFFRKDYDKLPSLTSEPGKANVWFIVSGDQNRDKQIIGGEYHYFAIDETHFATYPLKTAKAAYDELAQGGGYVASLGVNNQTGNINITKISLAYYDSGERSQFYEPIIVLEGERGFTAYVGAVTDAYIAQ